ncbi:multidrug efflux SMR transporter [Pediococcus argentinicus]|uniref:DMT family transporter n=1 Tax=Pediococcus argentinicus TaxID=480391 RepID=UPI00338D6ED1
MNWIYLVVTGCFEVVWASTMKLSEGFTKLNYDVYTVIGMILSFVFLSQATKSLLLSVAYPVWTGIGAVGSIIIGYVFFKDQVSNWTWVFILLLLISIIGIKITSKS